jgi:hypothetical protein
MPGRARPTPHWPPAAESFVGESHQAIHIEVWLVYVVVEVDARAKPEGVHEEQKQSA